MSGPGWGVGWGGGYWGGGGAPALTLQNLGFEIADLAGDAAQWSQISSSTWGEWASYVEGTELRAVETFEGSWGANESYVFAFVDAELEAAHYSATIYNPPLHAESFEAGWSHNEHFYTTTADFEAAVYGSGSVEGFESGWSNDTWGTFTTTAATYATGAKPAETFEDSWRSNELYVSDWGSVSSGAPSYYGVRGLGREAFEFVKADAQWTVGGIGDILRTAHGLALDYRLKFYADVGSSLPPELDAAATYWVVQVLDADHFLVGHSMGGTPITLSAGVGVLYLHEPFEFWAAETTTI